MSDQQPNKIWTVPNIITFFRIALVPFFMTFMYLGPKYPQGFWSELAIMTFMVAGISDNLDGYIARQYNQGSQLGKLLDPLADKLLISAALVMLLGYDHGVPPWAVATIIGREMAITGLRGMATEQGIVIAALPLGKVKAFAQMACIPLLIYADPLLGLPILQIGLVCLYVAVALSVVSGVEYVVKFVGKII